MIRPQRLPAWLLGAGILFAVARVPHAVWSKRRDEIDLYQRLGAAGYHLRLIDRSGRSARDLQWLREHTPEDCALVYAGEERGAFEFAAPLLFPRLLVRATAVAPDATHYAGRPLARATLPDGGGTGVLLLTGAVDHLTVGVRP